MQNTHSRIGRQIAETLSDDPAVFHLLNRGLTITAQEASYANGKLTLVMNEDRAGLLDGATSYRVIAENLQPYLESKEEGERPGFLDSFIKFEVITSVKGDLIVELARSRNSSVQVRDESLANLNGEFNFLKEIFEPLPYGSKIAYKENDDKPIDIREIIGLITLFHPKFEDVENPPIIGYSSKKACLELLQQDQDGYKSLKKIIPEILATHDYIISRMAEIYENIGGFSALNDKDAKTKSVKLGKVLEIRHLKEGFPLHYLEGGTQMAFYRFPTGWSMPILASLRGLCSFKGQFVRFKASPMKVFDRLGKAFVRSTLEASKELGRSPNNLGKNKMHWQNLHNKVINFYLRALEKGDTDKDIIL